MVFANPTARLTLPERTSKVQQAGWAPFPLSRSAASQRWRQRAARTRGWRSRDPLGDKRKSGSALVPPPIALKHLPPEENKFKKLIPKPKMRESENHAKKWTNPWGKHINVIHLFSSPKDASFREKGQACSERTWLLLLGFPLALTCEKVEIHIAGCKWSHLQPKYPPLSHTWENKSVLLVLN